MRYCRIVAPLWAAVKHPAFTGRPLFVVQPLDDKGADVGTTFVAIDTVQAGIGDKMVKQQVAIINSMTPAERANPDLLKNSRKKRIAAGSGTNAEQINKLLKMHRSMADMMKSMGSGKRGPMAGLAGMFGLGGGMPDLSKLPAPGPGGGLSPEALAEAQKKLEQLSGPGGKPSLPGLGKPTLPGLGSGGGLPGLGGFNPFRKK
jgi:signal recognition particle subunit SRP54